MRRKQYDLSTEFVLANNPDTGQNATVTRKAFETLYKDRGFVIVDEAEVDMSQDARAARRNERNIGGRKAGRGSAAGGDAIGSGQEIGGTGSAADMANRLGLEGDDDEGGKSK